MGGGSSKNEKGQQDDRQKVFNAIDEARKLHSKFPDAFKNPSELNHLRELVPMLDESEALLATGSEPGSALHELLKYTRDVMAEYLQHALNQWDLEDLKKHCGTSTMTGSTKMYEGIVEMIKGEDADFQRLQPELLKMQEYVKEGNHRIHDEYDDELQRMGVFWKMCSNMKKARFDALMKKIGEQNKADVRKAPVKGFHRALEKVLLRGMRKGLPWDVVRCMIVCTSVKQMLEVVSQIMKEPGVVVIGLNDKWSDLKEGWSDISLYIQFKDAEHDCAVGEVQIVHQKMLVAREKIGAHEAYAKTRFASEVVYLYKNLTQTPGLPYSCIAVTPPIPNAELLDGANEALLGSAVKPGYAKGSKSKELFESWQFGEMPSPTPQHTQNVSIRLNIRDQFGHWLYEDTETTFDVYLFLDGSVSTSCKDEIEVAAIIKYHDGMPFIKSITRGSTEVALCVEDVAQSVPLRDGMILILADLKVGPTFEVALPGGGPQLQLVPQKNFSGEAFIAEPYTFTTDFEVARGKSKKPTQGMVRCQVPHKCVSSSGHGAFVCNKGTWSLRWHPEWKEDRERLHATWMVMQPGMWYALRKGAKSDDMISVWCFDSSTDIKKYFGIICSESEGKASKASKTTKTATPSTGQKIVLPVTKPVVENSIEPIAEHSVLS